MFKKLHLQLIFFCSLIMTVILLAMTFICLSISESGLRKQSFADFRNNTDTVLTHLDNQTVLSLSWILQVEHNYQLILDIRDSGSPLFYVNLSDRESSHTLSEAARKTASEEYGLSADSFRSTDLLRQQETFYLNLPDMPQYYACVALLPKGDRFLDIAILYSTEPLNAQIEHQRLLFLAGTAVSLIVLTFLAWIFIGRMLKPIEKNRRRQVQFVAAASHELRSPLAVMLSSLSALRAAGNPQEAEKFADTIESEGERMSCLINDMLMLANADSGNWSIHPQSAELDTLLLQTYEKYEPITKRKKLQLQIELPEDSVSPCPCDAQRISQLLAILIDNALAYTQENGLIRLALRTRPGQFELIVSDNGPGIPDEKKQAVFERFYRIDDAHHSKDHFGLGLCIAAEIVRLHRGKITLTDTPGGGATFTVVLPGGYER